jgi:hypothetical protein
LDDILDLMGSDALQSEDAMREMWGDSIKAVKGQHARITYGDFLLLMKGQTRENPSPALPPKNIVKVSDPESMETSLSFAPLRKLPAVPEMDSSVDQGANDDTHLVSPSGHTVNDGLVATDGSTLDSVLVNSAQTPVRVTSLMSSRSAPSTPLDHKRAMEDEFIDSPLSMDDDEDITKSGPGVPGTSVSLTPPSTPLRGANDYITPSGGWRNVVGFNAPANDSLMLPGLPTPSETYKRRRARSLGNEDDGQSKKDASSLNVVADAVRDMLLPETDHFHASKEFDDVVKDKSKSALQVNRQLYRAHRHMRLAVLEASKRFEEQQAAHAREVILAQRETEEEKGMGMIQAGLVMRHGHTRQVSSEAIRQVLSANQAQQHALVEKANRRGGRGRRSRKKTISDMSSMLGSMGQEELGMIAVRAAADNSSELSEGAGPTRIVEKRSFELASLPEIPTSALTSEAGVHVDVSDGHLRKPTVPGEFRKTQDPFSKEGRYGAAVAWNS